MILRCCFVISSESSSSLCEIPFSGKKAILSLWRWQRSGFITFFWNLWIYRRVANIQFYLFETDGSGIWFDDTESQNLDPCMNCGERVMIVLHVLAFVIVTITFISNVLFSEKLRMVISYELDDTNNSSSEGMKSNRSYYHSFCWYYSHIYTKAVR